MTLSSLMDYYRFLKWEVPCFHCGKEPKLLDPNEVDHVKPPSRWGKGLGKRSHKGPPAWWALPLCPACHRARHLVREETFYGGRERIVEGVLHHWNLFGSIPEEWQEWYEARGDE